MTNPVVTIYVRHSAGCKYAGDEFARRCSCRKHFRYYVNGKRQRRKCGTRSWEEAERLKRELEDQLAGKSIVSDAAQVKPLDEAIETFIQDKTVEGISEDATDKYRRELGRLRTFAEGQGVFAVQGLTGELLTKYAATWARLYPSSQTRSIVRARCKAFLNYCCAVHWIAKAPRLPKIQVDEVPTMPLSPDQYAALLAATETFEDPETCRRAHALFQLMRYSGLAVGDSLKFERERLKFDPAIRQYRVETHRQKTGVWVSVLVPRAVAEELLALPREWRSKANGSLRKMDPRYLFWDGQSDIVNTWTRKTIPKAFQRANIEKVGNMTSHRLRDTFACDLLEKGVPLEEVSKLLGHESIKTTERSYAKWVKGRQDRLDNLVMATWAA